MEYCYEEVANAVVLQAVKDYRKARKKLRHHPENEKAKDMLKECEEFFLSKRFNSFTKLDGAVLLEKLEEEQGI